MLFGSIIRDQSGNMVFLFGGSEVGNCVVYLSTREKRRSSSAWETKISNHPVHSSEKQLTCLEGNHIY